MHRVPEALAGRPFTIQMAADAGISQSQLRTKAYRLVFRGVYVDAAVADSRELRFAAARLVIPNRGVACGWTAAWLHGVDVRRLDDMTVHVGFPKGRRIRSRAGIEVCQETLDPADVVEIDGLRVTTPVRTAFDCLRWLYYTDGVVVADALTHAGLTQISELLDYFAGKRRLRNLRIGERLLALVEPKSESPMETRLRLLLIGGGLPLPEPQWNVYDAHGTHAGRLDLAYVAAKVAVEYDGAEHWKQRREDDRRRARLRALGWDVHVFSADDVFQTPDAVVAQVRAALRARAA
jgi:predicted transcriptional regulator of viral defense system